MLPSSESLGPVIDPLYGGLVCETKNDGGLVGETKTSLKRCSLQAAMFFARSCSDVSVQPPMRTFTKCWQNGLFIEP
jgi:hypothetical protein